MARFAFSAFADEAGDSLAEQISAMKENGIKYFEPRNIDGRNIIKLGEEKLKEVRAALDDNGIKVGSLGSPIGKYSIYKDFETHLVDFKNALEACKILGCNKMRIFSFFVEKEDFAAKRDEIISRLKTMVEMAKEYGVTLCHENEARIYGEMPCEVKDLIETVPDLHAVFDPANYRLADADVIEGINASLIRFGYIHIKDAIYESKQIVPAGEGEGQIGRILDIVNDNYGGLVYLTLEPHLKVFAAYKDIDERELNGKYVFNTNREAFDFAVSSLSNVLINQGYRKDGNGEWIK